MTSGVINFVIATQSQRLLPRSRLSNPKSFTRYFLWHYQARGSITILQYLINITKEEENVSLKLSILTKRTEIELTHGFKIKYIYILASENEKSIKISAYLCDVGVKFEQAAREKSSNEKN